MRVCACAKGVSGFWHAVRTRWTFSGGELAPRSVLTLARPWSGCVPLRACACVEQQVNVTSWLDTAMSYQGFYYGLQMAFILNGTIDLHGPSNLSLTLTPLLPAGWITQHQYNVSGQRECTTHCAVVLPMYRFVPSHGGYHL